MASKETKEARVKTVSSEAILKCLEEVLAKFNLSLLPLPTNDKNPVDAWMARLPYSNDPRVCQAIVDAFETRPDLSLPHFYATHLHEIINGISPFFLTSSVF